MQIEILVEFNKDIKNSKIIILDVFAGDYNLTPGEYTEIFVTRTNNLLKFEYALTYVVIPDNLDSSDVTVNLGITQDNEIDGELSFEVISIKEDGRVLLA